jgi:hypothetical protein
MTGFIDPFEWMANISAVGETGQSGFGNQSQIARDTGGSKSYGVFGLNTWGRNPAHTSAGRFARQYGPQLGLTAPVGSPQFDQQWKRAVATNPEAVKAAQLDWYKKEIAAPVADNLRRVGVPDSAVNDQRVQAYFADRMVQQGPSSIENHADRLKRAWSESGGNPVSFLKNMSGLDKQSVPRDFRSYLAGHPNNTRGLYNRVDKREALSLTGGHMMGGAPQQVAQSVFPDPHTAPPMGGAPTPPEPPSQMMTPTDPPAGMPRIPTPPQVSGPPPITPQLADPAPPQAPMMGGAPFQGVPAGMPLMPPQMPMQPPMAPPPMAPPPMAPPAPTMMADAGAASGSMPSLFGGSGGMLGGMGGMLGGLFGGGGGGASAPQAPAAPPPPMGLDPMVLALLAQQGPFKFPDFNQFA